MNLAKWYREVEESGFDSFNTIAATLYDRSEDILNFYVNKASNAAAESFNAKIKLFRAKLRGVADFICFYILPVRDGLHEYKQDTYCLFS